MTVETLVFAALLTLLGGLLAAAFGADDLATLRAWWRRADLEDAALLARAAAIPTERARRCPRCSGEHCANWARDGAPCPPQRAPKLTDTLLGPGLHEPTAAYRRIVPYGWRPPRVTWSTLAKRVGGWPVGVLP